MGLAHPGVPHSLAICLRDTLSIKTFVETGTHVGNTAKWAAKHFDRVITIEVSEDLHCRAKKELCELPNVDLRLGPSPTILRSIVETLKAPALFWLDAGPGTGGQDLQCPLIEEIEAINSAAVHHAILVDDARLFVNPVPEPLDRDQWPSFSAVAKALRSHFPDSYIAVHDDIIICVPAGTRNAVERALYAQPRMPDVDVVIPVRNAARFLPACLDSVMAQTHAPRRVIVVDDGSTDATPEILAGYMSRWPALDVIRSAPRGVSHARNLGIRACKAEFIAFVDSDDVWVPDKLERQMTLFSAAGSRLGFVHCAYYCIDEAGSRREDRFVLEPRVRGNVFRDLLLEGNIVSGSCSAVVARRSLVDRVGGFDERLYFGEDWELWLKLAEISELDFVPEPLVGVRVHDQSAQNRSVARREEGFLQQTLLVLDKWYGRADFPPEIRTQYRKRALHFAMTQARPRLVPGFRDHVGFFFRLRACESRFGRQLYSGLGDFLAQIYRARIANFVTTRISRVRSLVHGLAFRLGLRRSRIKHLWSSLVRSDRK
jgi:glycosyltransferase involved in cell wall biosynthesis